MSKRTHTAVEIAGLDCDFGAATLPRPGVESPDKGATTRLLITVVICIEGRALVDPCGSHVLTLKMVGSGRIRRKRSAAREGARVWLGRARQRC
jgi:hypothetical protein